MKLLSWIEKTVVVALIVMLLLVILASTAEVAVQLFRSLINGSLLRVDLAEILPLLSGIMLVLIGIELLHTVQIYLKDQHLHVEVVVLVALIAIARKVIILDYKDITAPILFGLAALFLSLSAGYFLLKRADQAGGATTPTP